MRTLILTLLISLGLMSCKIPQKQDFSTKEMGQKHFVLEDFSGVKVSQGIEVEIVPSDKNEAYAESRAMEYLRIEVEDDVLVIRYENPEESYYIINPETKVKLKAKSIENFDVSSSGEIKIKGQFATNQANINVSSSGEIVYDFNGKSLNITASSSGEVKGNVNVEELNIQASSSADVELKGNANTAFITASSSADIESGSLEVKKAKVKTSSSADVELSISEDLEAQASSSGDIRYKTIGKVNANVRASSSGSIEEVKSF